VIVGVPAAKKWRVGIPYGSSKPVTMPSQGLRYFLIFVEILQFQQKRCCKRLFCIDNILFNPVHLSFYFNHHFGTLNIHHLF
jgi:hypothetical protein